MKRLILLLLIPGFHMVRAQNLVPNGDLEDVNICDEYNCPCSPSAWFIVKNAVPTGYYHVYPDPAASGREYFEIAAVNYGTTRQYWQTKLLCNLVPGEKYNITVKIAERDNGPNLHDIGFYFTNGFIFSKRDTLLQPPDYINFLDASIHRRKHGWFLLKKEFTAAAASGYLVVGNFSAEDNAAILKKRNYGNRPVGIMIDDIAVEPQQRVNCAGYQLHKDSLYALTRRHSGDSAKINSRKKDSTLAAKRVRQEPPMAKTDTIRLSNLLFEFDQYVLLRPDTLEAFRHLLSNPTIRKIKVVGYTDDAGSEQYNATLSLKRAKEIARLLTEKFEFFSSAIETEGRGISTDFTDKGQNRRVDIYIYY